MSYSEHHIKSLEVASSSYHKVLEENRFLYNQVQDLKGAEESRMHPNNEFVALTIS